ncbi:chemotaxis protein CheB [Deinococcus multiflagellatus]|uniref:chemotaxis protein CheB n=1 Tax=Deinococcus multiflagellatus TaxID=1656887 RepID=UPI001CCE0893|nr:chemotaxis protein CheB [Deinococcus multiflagellatus]MBZ9713285.1 chemotaxis protein CheB [Deinococcus multiflagellatus]
MTPLPVVVIGASAGGIEALMPLVAGLDPALGAPVCVALHLSPHVPSLLPDILGRAGPLPATQAQDGEPARPGHIYVAPPDHHLLLDGERLAVTRGPRENRFRPAVDALFRSAAQARGPGVIGVVLSGAMDDGASGLWTIQRRGGVAVVQDPQDAAFDSMPRSALAQVTADHVAPAHALGPLLSALVAARGAPQEARRMTDDERARLDLEVRLARQGPASPTDVSALGPYSPFTCPECHGAMVQIEEGGALRFRCHTGHAYSAPVLLAELSQAIEQKLYETRRVMDEGILLLGRLGQRLPPAQAQALLSQAQSVQARANILTDLAMSHAPLAGDGP